MLLSVAIAGTVFVSCRQTFSPTFSRLLTIACQIGLAAAILSIALLFAGIHAPDPNLNGVPFVLFISLAITRLTTRPQSSALRKATAIAAPSVVFLMLVLFCIPFINVLVYQPLTNPLMPYSVSYQSEEYSCYSKSAYGPSHHVIFENHTLYSKPLLRTEFPYLPQVKNLRKTESGLEITIRPIRGNSWMPDTTFILTDDPSLY